MRQRTEEHTLAWHLWCCDSDLTWLKQPAEANHSRSPTQRSSRGRSWTQRKRSAGEGPSCGKLGQWKTNSAESSQSSVSDSRRPPVKVGGPRSYGWRDMPNEILIPSQSLISCFLEPPANRRAAVGTIEGLWRSYSSACPKGAICWAPVAATRRGGFNACHSKSLLWGDKNWGTYTRVTPPVALGTLTKLSVYLPASLSTRHGLWGWRFYLTQHFAFQGLSPCWMNELVNGKRECALPYICIQEKPNHNLFVPVQSLGFEYQLTAQLYQFNHFGWSLWSFIFILWEIWMLVKFTV